MINRLVDGGFVSRVYGQNDRRNVLVSITDRGKSVLTKDIENYGKVLEKIIGALEPNELETFTKTFEKMVTIQNR